MVFRNISKAVGLLRKRHSFLPRAALIRPHIDYGDILYDQAYVFSPKAGIYSV